MHDEYQREAKARTLHDLAQHAYWLPGPLVYGLLDELLPALSSAERAAAVDTILAAPDSPAAARDLVDAEAAGSWERHCRSVYGAPRLTAVR